MQQEGDGLAVPRWDQLSRAARPGTIVQSGLGFLQTPGARPQELGWALTLVPSGSSLCLGALGSPEWPAVAIQSLSIQVSSLLHFASRSPEPGREAPSRVLGDVLEGTAPSLDGSGQAKMPVGWRAQLIHTGPRCLGLELIHPAPGERATGAWDGEAEGALGGRNPPTAPSPVSQPGTSSVTAAHPGSLI